MSASAMMRLNKILLEFELLSDVNRLRRSLSDYARDTADRDCADIARKLLGDVESNRWGYFTRSRRSVSDATHYSFRS
mgnify:CR=1 FL=1